MSTSLTRRDLLRAAAALALLPGCTRVPPVDPEDLPQTAVPLADIVAAWFGEGDRGGVLRLGEAWLDSLDGSPEEDLTALLDPIADLETADQVVQALQDTLRADQDAGRVGVPLGWVLAPTEARLCALAWVVGDTPPRAEQVQI